MKILLDTNIKKDIKEYLLTQEGILDVQINEIKLFEEIKIKHNDKITPIIIMKYIDLFQEDKFSTLIEFDKETKSKVNTLKYTIDDICCEYCYMGLLRDLFDNKHIKSVKTNYSLENPNSNIQFEIEYDEGYNKEEIIKIMEANK